MQFVVIKQNIHFRLLASLWTIFYSRNSKLSAVIRINLVTKCGFSGLVYYCVSVFLPQLNLRYVGEIQLPWVNISTGNGLDIHTLKPEMVPLFKLPDYLNLSVWISTFRTEQSIFRISTIARNMKICQYNGVRSKWPATQNWMMQCLI